MVMANKITCNSSQVGRFSYMSQHKTNKPTDYIINSLLSVILLLLQQLDALVQGTDDLSLSDAETSTW
eukprot:m.125645 g.125645  ORF g.125645 m.125645 type:complete len:68 (+) comp9431_c0_seq6:1827-2030(+)